MSAVWSWEPNGAYQMPAGSLQQLSRNLWGEKGALSPPKASHGFDGAAAGQRRRLSAFRALDLNFKLPAGELYDASRGTEIPEQVIK